MSQSAEPLPDGAETRLASFTELVATAIAKTDAREQMQALADEQASLRRVATLVAEGAPPDALFRAFAGEVASVVGVPTVTLSHHHADGSFTVVAETNNPGFQSEVAGRWPGRASPRRSTRPVASRASTTTQSWAAPSQRPCTTRRFVRPQARRSWSTARSGATSPWLQRAQSRCRPGRSSGCSTSPRSSRPRSRMRSRATLSNGWRTSRLRFGVSRRSSLAMRLR